MNNDMTPYSHGHGDTAADAASGLTRRQWLQGALALTAAGLSGSLALRALADGVPSAVPIDAFMTLSQALTGKTSLNRAVGERLLQALQKGSFQISDALPTLAGALASGTLTPDQEALALRILEAWYLGIVDNVVITYEEALMFGVVSDTLVIRSYCPNQPGFWADKPIERQA